MGNITNLIIIVLLILLTAFFVASEYSVIRVRISRIDQLASAGNRKAKAVQDILSKLDEYLSACQLGNTLTALALGWLGEDTIEHILHPVFEWIHTPESLEGIISFILAFAILTFLEVVVGELVPKSFAIQLAEPMAMFFARPLIIFYKITYPINWFLSRSSRLITGLFGVKPANAHESVQTEAELRLALSEGYKSGQLNKFEYRYLNNIFELDRLAVQGIMVPRTQMMTVSTDESIQDFLEQIEEHQFDRYPVTLDGDKDHIVGMVHTKELLTAVLHRSLDMQQPVTVLMRPIIQVIDTIRAQDLLLKMQKEGIHLTVLKDEFGGTTGLVTTEDIIESIVGEIDDQPIQTIASKSVKKLSDNHYLMHSTINLTEVNHLLRIRIATLESFTLGGWLLSKKFDLKPGDQFTERDYLFVVKDMEDGQHMWVDVTKIEQEQDEEASAAHVKQETTK
ncbi:CBS domain containing-hemolysin-like protein [Paenibacillus shirakamiensis]|uniref:CBS domain containing-hemolysin-like protein n=1 Tax=Paenibacillus shirakamiensis TaxID=1265935 RepID=A0ABS4JGR6_9BACL|nr:hemolysin family protein [Paenibacillus shirakamiensis]MBP2000914.1 CBS domain containing-hemolysin-like protein [Paenibacillus shirakamiensis]